MTTFRDTRFRKSSRLVGILVGAVAAVALGAVPVTAAPAPVPADPSVVRTPGLDEVFNDYAVGTLREGRPGTPEEIVAALGTDDPFYDEPALTGSERPGQLLKVAQVEPMYFGWRPANLDAYRLMFVTTGLDAETPEISTGIVLIPDDGTPAAERKVISYQEANDSVGGYCHPSSQWTGGNPADASSWSALGPLALMLDRGYAVVISDVGNNGDPAPHGVFAGKFAGHSQLDAIRAAMAAEQTGIASDAPIALFGIAGGGVGAGFAAEAHATYAPELNIRATVMEGMVVDQRSFLRMADGSVGSGFAFATLLGLEPKYPDMRIDEKLTPQGRALADWYRTQCQTPAYFMAPFVPLSALFEGGRSPVDIPEFQPVFDDNLLGTRAPASKVLITSCAGDDSFMSLIPAQDSRDLAARYRDGGTDVTYAPSDCNMLRLVTDPYGWGTDLFGMQTIDWIDENLGR